MKKNAGFVVFGLLMFLGISTVFGQQGFTGPQEFPGRQGFTGPSVSPYTGPSFIITTVQLSALPNKSPAILRGNIIQYIGGDRYTFRDSSGDIEIKIKHDRWRGVFAGASDQVEISGELKRDKKNWRFYYFDVKFISRI